MIVAIHQPNYLPWAGYFHKIARCDHFILLDDVQYIRRGYTARNRIKTPNGVAWLTVPVHVKGQYTQSIHQMTPRYDIPWIRNHLRSLELNYARSPFFDDVMEQIVAPVFARAQNSYPGLAQINEWLIERVCQYLRITAPMTRASALSVATTSTQRLIDLVKSVGGDAYLSGHGGERYQDPAAFADAEVALHYSDFEHPTYPQLWGPFVENLSILDMLCNCGRSAARWFVRSQIARQTATASALVDS